VIGCIQPRALGPVPDQEDAGSHEREQRRRHAVADAGAIVDAVGRDRRGSWGARWLSVR
jgi:hypothetical protein